MEQKIVKVDFTTILPKDVQLHIVDHLLAEKQIVKSLQALIAISRVNKTLHALVAQEKKGRYSIQALADKMKMYHRGILYYLSKQGVARGSRMSYADMLNDKAFRNCQVTKATSKESLNELQALIGKVTCGVTYKRKKTILHFALDAQAYPMAIKLIKAGLNVNIRKVTDTYPYPILHDLIIRSCWDDYCYREDNNQIWSVLAPALEDLFAFAIGAGADLNCRTAQNVSPLVKTMQAPDLKEYLQEISKTEYTSLMLAIKINKLHFAHLILQAGPDLSARNAKNQTAYVMALQEGHVELADAIFEKMQTSK